jgi:hypothetical protein
MHKGKAGEEREGSCIEESRHLVNVAEHAHPGQLIRRQGLDGKKTSPFPVLPAHPRV